MTASTRVFRSFWELTKGHRRLFAIGATALVAVDLLELLPPLALGILIDSVTKGEHTWPPLLIAVLYIGVFLIQSVVRYPVRMGFIGASSRIATALRERYAVHLLGVRRSSLMGRSSGDLMNRAVGDIGAVEGSLATGALFLCDCVIYLVAIPVALYVINPQLCLLASFALPVLAALAHLLVRKVTTSSQEVQESFGRLIARAHENAVGVQTVRAYGLEEREALGFESLVDHYVATDLRRAKWEALFAGSVQLLMALALFSVLLLGGRQAIESRLSLGQFVTFFQYMGMMAWPLTGLAWAFLLFKKGGVGLGRIREILELPLAANKGAPVPSLQGSIEIRNLSYQPSGDADPLFSGLDFSIRPGERVAFMGPTGSGKSTLVDLLTRIIDPPAGTVFIDGLDVMALHPSELRSRIAVAPQEAFLFSGTVRENIAVGALDVDHSAQVARVCGDEFVQGLETPAGEKGSGLSGGQRQRVSLARAVGRRPSILILDDACSALDEETEDRILRQILQGNNVVTVLFFTNRVRAAMQADRIVILDEGRVVQQGTPAGLKAADGPFQAWLTRQDLTRVFDHA